MNMTLYDIETNLLALFESRGEAEAEGDAEAVAAFDHEIAAVIEAEIKKVDGIAAFLRECEARAEMSKLEALRLTERRNLWTKRAERVKEATLHVMREVIRETKLEGRFSTLSVKKNPASLQIDAEDLLPPEYFTYTLRLTHNGLKDVLQALRSSGDNGQWLARNLKVEQAPINADIKDALKKGDVVPGAKLVDDRYRIEVA